jgi:hypothetical protein
MGGAVRGGGRIAPSKEPLYKGGRPHVVPAATEQRPQTSDEVVQMRRYDTTGLDHDSSPPIRHQGDDKHCQRKPFCRDLNHVKVHFSASVIL